MRPMNNKLTGVREFVEAKKLLRHPAVDNVEWSSCSWGQRRPVRFASASFEAVTQAPAGA
jgi:hypothetical protein